MWTKKNFINVLFSFLALLWFSPCVGGCSPTYQITEEELTTLETNLATLEQHNATLKAILTTQDSELTEALNLLMKSSEELTKLRNELTIARNETQSARNSLEIANQELAKASESFKQYAQDRDRTESRLRTQRNIWEALFAVAVGYAIAK